MATPGVSAFGYDLLRYGDFNLRSALTPTNIITKILPAIRQRLSEFDQLSKDGYNWGEIVIAKGGKAFRLTSNFTYEVLEESLAVFRSLLKGFFGLIPVGGVFHGKLKAGHPILVG